jgi:RNA polymerase sigma-70 factor (ECF subfamily)
MDNRQRLLSSSRRLYCATFMHTTPASLLHRLQQANEQADWERFVKLYTPLLCHWARQLGLAETDADDLVQDVFVLLVQRLPEFRYDPNKRFRGWLWTVTLNKWRERHRRQPTAVSVGDRDLDGLASPDGAAALDETEYQQYLVGRALQIMQAEFEPTTWKAFWESVSGGRPAAQVAAELGITENAVYLAKGRVLRQLREELRGLLD